MRKIFYTKDKNYAFQCKDCRIESHLCPALQNLEYETQYDRLTETETIYVQKKDLQVPKFEFVSENRTCRDLANNDNHHNNDLLKNSTAIRFYSMAGVYGTLCHKRLEKYTEEDIQECQMLQRLKEHNIPYDIECYQPRPYVDVKIITQRLDQLYIFDGWAVLGACTDCKWHSPWQTHDCMPKKIIPCENCMVYKREDCPAQRMLNDGYTACESKLKCVALRHAQIIKEKYKDNQLHL